MKENIAAFERQQQNQPGFFDFAGKKLKANQRRGKELSVMYKTMIFEYEKTNK